MNILFIGTTDILGGAAKISWKLKEYAEQNGHSVSMFVADKRSNDPKVKVIPRQKWRKLLNFIFATEKFLLSDWIIDTPEFKNADIIHCHNLHGRFFNLETLQKISLLKPVVWTLHDEWAITPHCAYTFEGKEMKNGLYVCQGIDTPPRLLWDNTKYLSDWKNNIYKNSRLHIVTPSKWLLDRVKNTILKDQDLRLIYNGIETNLFQKTDKTEARNRLSLPQHKKIVLFLADDAKNNPWKGWGSNRKIIDDYKNRENILFLCVGNHQNHQNENNVEYRTHINSKEELALYYSAADALLFISLAENFPLVILEAMSVGLPIVAYDVGGVKEALEHKLNGYLAKYGNLDEIMIGLEWCLSNTTTPNQRFDANEMCQEYMKLYEEIN